MLKIINFSQIIVSVFLIVFILMQPKGSGMGTVFGGDGGVAHTKRGAEKWLFYATITLIVIFIGLGVAHLIVQQKGL